MEGKVVMSVIASPTKNQVEIPVKKSDQKKCLEKLLINLSFVISSEARSPVSGRFREVEKPAFRAGGAIKVSLGVLA
jgi:hypothetical protein